MKAKVKETGEIFDVYGVVNKTCEGYGLGEVALMVDDKDSFNYDMTPAYWEKLKHEYAGMAMQQLVHLVNVGYEYVYEETAIIALNFATALVEKLKEKK